MACRTEATREKYAARAKTLGIDILVNGGVWHDTSEELTVSKTAFPSGINDTKQYFASRGLDVGLHSESSNGLPHRLTMRLTSDCCRQTW